MNNSRRSKPNHHTEHWWGFTWPHRMPLLRYLKIRRGNQQSIPFMKLLQVCMLDSQNQVMVQNTRKNWGKEIIIIITVNNHSDYYYSIWHLLSPSCSILRVWSTMLNAFQRWSQTSQIDDVGLFIIIPILKVRMINI